MSCSLAIVVFCLDILDFDARKPFTFTVLQLITVAAAVEQAKPLA